MRICDLRLDAFQFALKRVFLDCPMAIIKEISDLLRQLAPLELAESWDNVGLLVGDETRSAQRVMTCLTITQAAVDEAIAEGAQLIIAHHPLPFRPIPTITAETTTGRLLLQLIAHSIAVYSAHTAFDSAATGVNQHLAIGLDLHSIRPLRTGGDGDPDEGAGRFGVLNESISLVELANRAKSFLEATDIRCAGDRQRSVERIAIACGSGGSFLESAIQAECDALLTGEASFHHCLEAEANNVGLVLVGHFASERFAMVALADYLTDQLPDASVWACRAEQDPIWRP